MTGQVNFITCEIFKKKLFRQNFFPKIPVTGNRIISRTFRGLKSNKHFLFKKGGLAFPLPQNPKNKTVASLPKPLSRYSSILTANSYIL